MFDYKMKTLLTDYRVDKDDCLSITGMNDEWRNEVALVRVVRWRTLIMA